MGRSRATYARPASRRTAFNLRAVALPGDHAAPADGERPRQARLSGASQGGRGVQRHSVTRFETHRREGLGGSSTPARSVRSSRRCSSTPPRGRNESYVLEPANRGRRRSPVPSPGHLRLFPSGSSSGPPSQLGGPPGARFDGPVVPPARHPAGGAFLPQAPANGNFRRLQLDTSSARLLSYEDFAGVLSRTFALRPGAVIFDLDVDVLDRGQTAGFQAAGASESVAALPALSALPGVPGCPAATRFKFAMQKVLIAAGRMPGPDTGTAYPEGRTSSSPPAGPWVGVAAVTQDRRMHGAGPRRPRWADTHLSESRFHQLPRAPYLGSFLAYKSTEQLLQLKFLVRLDSLEQPAIPEN